MDKEFPKGLFIKEPHENAPEFVKYVVSIKRGELMQWLASKTDEWINLQAKTSREGKLYLEVDNWKPQQRQNGGEQPSPPYPEHDQEQGNPEQGTHVEQYPNNF